MSDLQLVRAAECLLGVATILALVWVGVPEARPWAVVCETVRRTVRSGQRLLYLAAGLSILIFNYLYLVFDLDRACTRLMEHWFGGEDFTHLVHGLEGETVARLQEAMAWLPLTWFLGFVYVVVFPSLVFVAILVFDRLRNHRGLAMVLIGYVFNYLFVLPFYLFFPVREVSHYYGNDLGSSGVRLLLDDIGEVVMRAYRAMSGLDNCFPSFHTSLAVTIALVCWHAGRRRFAWLITFFAVANGFSTLYLGIHWLTDVAAGVVVGVVSYTLARRLSRRWAERASS